MADDVTTGGALMGDSGERLIIPKGDPCPTCGFQPGIYERRAGQRSRQWCTCGDDWSEP